MTLSPPQPALRPLPKVRRQRLGIRLSQPVFRRLREYAAAKGRNESAIIEDLVVGHLDTGGARHAESAPVSPVDRLVAAIDDDRAARASEIRTIRRELHNVFGAVELLSEAFGRFVGYWFASRPEPPKDPAARAALIRDTELFFDAFARSVIDHFQRGHRFVPADPKADSVRAPPPRDGRPPGRGGGTL
ncbi:MAG: hypothetical protein ABSC94_30195 [Polyangiaceae bacterium]